MNNEKAPVTEAFAAIFRREQRQNRLARISLIVLGVLMLLAGIAGVAAGKPALPRVAAMCMGAVFYLLSYSTLICGAWSVGMIPQAGIGAYIFSLAALWPLITAPKSPVAQIAVVLIAALPAVPALFFLSTCAVILLYSLRRPPSRGAYTLIVLGCKLKGDQPGRMLKRRLDRAARLLGKDDGLSCIVTGGRAPDSDFCEGEVMRRYLLERGIAPGRVVAETQASTTYENFVFSRRILKELGLPPTVGIVSDRFHQLRARRIAITAGISSFPVCCETAWYLRTQFWMREVLCIAERMVRGHW